MKATKVVAAKPQPDERFYLANGCKAWEPGINWVGVDNIFSHVPGGGYDIPRVTRWHAWAGEKPKRFSRVVVFCKN